MIDLPQELQGLEQIVRDDMAEIPFGNSQFQIEQLILPKESLQRSYRQALLELRDKYNALRKAQFRRERIHIEIRKLLRKVSEEQDPLEKELLHLDIQEKEFDMSDEDKLIKDAIAELSIYFKAYKAMPKYTRAQFEESEQEHWKRRAIQQAERDVLTTGSIGQGNIELLAKVGFNPYKVQNDLRLLNQEQYKNASLMESATIQVSSPNDNDAITRHSEHS